MDDSLKGVWTSAGCTDNGDMPAPFLPEPKTYIKLTGHIKSQSTATHRKRKQRETFACQSCRQRKVRCDGTRPICRTCGRRNIACSYLEESSEGPRQDGNLQWQTPPDTTPRHVPPDRRHIVNAMGVLTAQPQPAEREGQFFGESSIAALLQGIQASSVPATPATNAAPRDSHAHHPSWSESSTQRLLGSISRFEFENCSLPPKPLADHLLNCYWDEVHVLYPFIHKETFLRGYSRLWSSEPDAHAPSTESRMGLGDTTSSPIVFHSALNAVLALGCQFSALAGEDREAKSEVFLQRSNALLRQMDLLDHGDLSLVQALLLNTHYLQSTPFADRCWNAIGLACRMAEGIGLHSTDHDDRWSYAELQIRRCVWHSCVMIEMSASMALGRPSMISSHISVPFPEAMDDTFTGALDPRVDTFFTCNMKLFYIMGDILNRIYEPRRVNRVESSSHPDPSLEVTSAIAPLDLELSSFASSLPSYLQWEISPRRANGNRQLRRQTNVLHARYLHLKILLYRPILSRLCRVDQNHNLPTSTNIDMTHPMQTEPEINLDYSYRCVNAALELVQLLGENDQASLPAWWYTVLYTFTAGIVLTLAHLRPEIIRQFTDNTLTVGWERCLTFLEHKVAHNTSSRKCAHDLRRAYHLVAAQRHQALERSVQQPDLHGPPHQDPGGDGPVDWAYGAESQEWADHFLADLLWDDVITTIPLYF
ncbi:hypothetical protein FE257_008917 [Aspergillus nanangensis]|uniref:Zn(2)-C6 fungal-type domain-containing protein n=1 Tax=Aspergillus nanangensis TaxID=2582783 RepID=A0AAD4CWS7_ASPNN|nr:hypothetical protein FE257_008917 [Aspergillus nanangensis]